MSQIAKLQRDITFDAKNFNIDFELQDKIIEEETIKQQKKEIISEEQKKQEDMRKMMKDKENIFIDMKELFFEILDKLAVGKNPFTEIMADQKKLFTFALLLLITGGLMLFLSNLMINKQN
jgi:hypothetical protein